MHRQSRRSLHIYCLSKLSADLQYGPFTAKQILHKTVVNRQGNGRGGLPREFPLGGPMNGTF